MSCWVIQLPHSLNHSGHNVLITKNNMGVNGHDTLFHIRLRHSKRTPLLSFSKFHSHSLVFNHEQNAYLYMSVKCPLLANERWSLLLFLCSVLYSMVFVCISDNVNSIFTFTDTVNMFSCVPVYYFYYSL